MTFSVTSFAEVTLSKTYSFPVEKLELVEAKLQSALDRDTELKDYPIFASIDLDKGISLWCSPHQPNANGEGCQIKFLIEMLNDLNLIIVKNLVLGKRSKEIKAQLATIDPNKTKDHQHFGSLFGRDDSTGSHYFCEPSGEEGKKTWACFLVVTESFN